VTYVVCVVLCSVLFNVDTCL